MKSVDVKSSIYIDFNTVNNKEGPKFEVNDHVRTSKYKHFFAKCYILNWSEEVFLITKVKNAFLWTYVIGDLKDEEIVGKFYERYCEKLIRKNLR